MIFSRSPSKRRVQENAALTTTFVLTFCAMVAFVTWPREEPKDVVSEDFYGEPIAVAFQPTVAGDYFDIRKSCRIARFGVAPWRFNREPKGETWAAMTHRAMLAAGLPHEAARKAVLAMRTGRPDETLGMGDAYGQSHATGAYFAPRYDTSYRVGNRYTACLDSATRFGFGRQESATVYRVMHDGILYYVGEFLACGNVTRFYPAQHGWAPGVAPPAPSLQGAPPAPGTAYPSPGAGGGPGAGSGHGTRPSVPGNVNQVPEPFGLGLFGAAIVALVYVRRRKHAQDDRREK